jgi:Protein of unknown function (DUF4231)
VALPVPGSGDRLSFSNTSCGAVSITSTTPEAYLKERVTKQLDWYGKNARGNKTRYQVLRLLQISLGILVSAGGVYADTIPHGAFWLSGFGVVISLSAAWETVFDHQNNWIRYRRIKEDLNREKILYETCSGPYRKASADNNEDEASFTLFVSRVEGLLSEEVERWGNDAARPAEGTSKG